MGRRFLIAGTGARVGKTTVGCALAFAFKARGMRVGVIKPCETGCIAVNGVLDPVDARALAFAASSTARLDAISPYRYRSPLAPPLAAAADGLPEPNVEHIARCYREIAVDADAMIVEGWGALDTALASANDGPDFADLAATLDLEVVIVAPTGAEHAADASRAFERVKSRGLLLAGYILCDIDPPASSETVDVNQSDARLLGRMRYREPLAKTIVEKLL